MRIAGVQMDVRFADPDSNRGRMGQRFAQARASAATPMTKAWG